MTPFRISGTAMLEPERSGARQAGARVPTFSVLMPSSGLEFWPVGVRPQRSQFSGEGSFNISSVTSGRFANIAVWRLEGSTGASGSALTPGRAGTSSFARSLMATGRGCIAGLEAVGLQKVGKDVGVSLVAQLRCVVSNHRRHAPDMEGQNVCRPAAPTCC